MTFITKCHVLLNNQMEKHISDFIYYKKTVWLKRTNLNFISDQIVISQTSWGMLEKIDDVGTHKLCAIDTTLHRLPSPIFSEFPIELSAMILHLNLRAHVEGGPYFGNLNPSTKRAKCAPRSLLFPIILVPIPHFFSSIPIIRGKNIIFSGFIK
ncbi:hypothetical protein ACJX0J_030399, partial [Zea mays]